MNRDFAMEDTNAGGHRETNDGTFPGCEIEGDELEFLKAVDEFRTKHRKKFPTNLEILAILKGLGYRKEPNVKTLTLEEQATNAATMHHIATVQTLIHRFVKELLDRADLHDQSKLEPPEVELFAEWTPKLAGSTYGSAEYNDFRKKLGPALAHHYAKNRHHPEHFKDGVNDMTLVDLVEMFCDWKAATMRHNDGNIRKSIEHNADRFGLSPQLVKILENTVDLVGESS